METTVLEIFGLIDEYGQQKYGENVTVTSHMVQSGMLALTRGYDEELVIAAFLHDIGHLVPSEVPAFDQMGKYGQTNHEAIGADYLRSKGFSERICFLVGSHVEAKRYLAAERSYYRKLSRASRSTLQYQGGPMKEWERKNLERHVCFEDMIRLRMIDDEAKACEVEDMDLFYFKEMLRTYFALKP